jgi:hypothetical protein
MSVANTLCVLLLALQVASLHGSGDTNHDKLKRQMGLSTLPAIRGLYSVRTYTHSTLSCNVTAMLCFSPRHWFSSHCHPVSVSCLTVGRRVYTCRTDCADVVTSHSSLTCHMLTAASYSTTHSICYSSIVSCTVSQLQCYTSTLLQLLQLLLLLQ